MKKKKNSKQFCLATEHFFLFRPHMPRFSALNHAVHDRFRYFASQILQTVIVIFIHVFMGRVMPALLFPFPTVFMELFPQEAKALVPKRPPFPVSYSRLPHVAQRERRPFQSVSADGPALRQDVFHAESQPPVEYSTVFFYIDIIFVLINRSSTSLQRDSSLGSSFVCFTSTTAALSLSSSTITRSAKPCPHSGFEDTVQCWL